LVANELRTWEISSLARGLRRRRNTVIPGEAALSLLVTTLHLLRRPDGPSNAWALVDRLEPSDFVQTEHIILVGLAKEIRARGQPLTLESLELALRENDPAGFVAICREQLKTRSHFRRPT
jgi:hypothetical protein